MELFQKVGKYLFPTNHALMIQPFKNIWESDHSDDNIDSIRIFTYVELLCSPKKSNPYFGYSEQERIGPVKREVWGEDAPDVENDPIIIEAVSKYQELLRNSSPTFGLYESSLQAAEKLKDQLKSIDFSERTRGGAMVIKPKDVTSALKEIPDTIKSLELLRSKLNQEIVEEARTRNQREIGAYEE